MRHRLTLIFSIIIVACVLSIAGVVGTAGGSSEAGVAHFRETVVTHTDVGGFAGAPETWRTQVWLPRKAQAVGTGVIACIRIEQNTTIRECNGTYILPQGRLQVAGQIINRAGFQLAITGGSGVYAPAAGVMVVQPGGLITFFLS